MGATGPPVWSIGDTWQELVAASVSIMALAALWVVAVGPTMAVHGVVPSGSAAGVGCRFALEQTKFVVDACGPDLELIRRTPRSQWLQANGAGTLSAGQVEERLRDGHPQVPTQLVRQDGASLV